MNPASDFLASMKDLRRCTDASDEYEHRRIPGLIRLLLLDGLVDRVNRHHRKKLTFRIGATLPFPGFTADPANVKFESVLESFDPDQAPPFILASDATRKQFLAAVVMVVEGSEVTVVELIRNLAYVQGLTHPGQPKKAKDEALLYYRRMLKVGGSSAGLREIRAIGRVVHTALKPIADAVGAPHGSDAA